MIFLNWHFNFFNNDLFLDFDFNNFLFNLNLSYFLCSFLFTNFLFIFLCFHFLRRKCNHGVLIRNHINYLFCIFINLFIFFIWDYLLFLFLNFYFKAFFILLWFNHVLNLFSFLGFNRSYIDLIINIFLLLYWLHSWINS